MKPKKPRTKWATEQELRLALLKISELAQGIADNSRDYRNCFLQARNIANEALSEKCAECGK